METEKVAGPQYFVEFVKQNADKHKPKTVQDEPSPPSLLENTYEDKYNDAAAAEIKNSGRSDPDEDQEKIQVYDTPGSMLQKFRESIEAIRNYDGFTLGVYEKIDQFPSLMQFKLKDFLKIEEQISQSEDTLEANTFTIHRIRQEVAKALKGQANIEPEKALTLIR